ncbi:CdaR family transcriptional regulator [Secundilactobacillus collinoides]|uniref:Sugar diacid utilization regulator n=1 Tax=Secundilactobacillus collinoides TaxID=33960 RepID=A0A166GF50_SECCO|nr:sugar diacid recognition domain-containing protein [Secundilactobacillus collinoides]KZL38884.1 sugar diacid utilization regulator [Secundilactobacillus collinoides]
MELDPKLAQSIVDKMMDQLPFNVNMMNKEGYIIASGDASRINTLHVGALDAIEQRKTLTMADSHGNNGQPGVNMPVFFGNSIIGVIGITGDPEVVLPFAALLRTATELLISQNQANQIEKENENRLNRFLYQWAQVKDDINQHTSLLLDAKELGIDILKKRVAIAIKYEKQPIVPADAADYVISMSDNTTIILTNLQTTIDRCLKLLHRKAAIRVGIGSKTINVGNSIEEAIKTLEIANLFQDKDYLYFNQVQFIYALLQSKLPVEPIVNKFNELDQTPMGKELINTLLGYIENNQNINKTAEALHIHRNTLNYRLNKLKDDLGLDIHKLTDLFQLYAGYLYFSQSHIKN